MTNGIGWAVKQLIDGHKVRRSGWLSKTAYLIYYGGTKGANLRKGSPYAIALGDVTVDIDPHVDMFTSKGSMQPGWLTSQADLLATDWVLADVPPDGEAVAS